MKICNRCGKEFEEKDLLVQNTEEGTEYHICRQCNEGVEISGNTEYYICKQCGYPMHNDEFKGICKFCEQTSSFEKLALTEVEEEMLDTNPQKLYKEKLGDEAANKIADWIESPKRKEVGIRHKRDRIIDTASLVGIILAYILLEFTMKTYSPDNKLKFLTLLLITVFTLFASPSFKKADRKPHKKTLPLWWIYVILALLVDLFIIVMKFA